MQDICNINIVESINPIINFKKMCAADERKRRDEKEERRVNAKSLLGVLSLGIMGGTKIRIIAGGPDEEQAVEELVKLVESGFAE